MMRKAIIVLFVLVMAAFSFGQAPAASENANIVKTNLSQAEIDHIIKKFTENERLFRSALSVYAFKRSATVQTIGLGGQITGSFHRDSFMTFGDNDARIEKILFAPISTLTEVQITAADLDNLGGIDPFAIEPKVADQYNFTYVGKEKIDELNLFVFDVEPKVKLDDKKGIAKYFQGRVWVDDRDLMIVKSKGKAVPEGKERFPIIETWRENIDGKYWFPSYSSSDGNLVFPKGDVVHLKMKVTYTDYKQGHSDVRILDDDGSPIVEPTPTPKKP